MSNHAQVSNHSRTSRKENSRTLGPGRRAVAEARARREHRRRRQWWLGTIYAGIVIGVVGAAVWLLVPSRPAESTAPAAGQVVSVDADM